MTFRYLLICTGLSLLTTVAAQSQETVCGNLYDTTYPGNITYHNPPLLDSLIDQRIKENKAGQTYQGYRIQIYLGSDRSEANEAKSVFLKDYEDVKAYLVYQQPYFKIRVGDFRNRIEAQKLYYELQPKFNSVIIVPDKIDFTGKDI